MSLPDAQYTSTTTAFRLTATPATGVAFPLKDPGAYGQRPLACLLQADTHDIRFTTDGVTVPTASVGQLLVAGGEPFLYAGSLINLQFIQVASGSKLNVSYVPITATIGPQGPPGAQGLQGPVGPTGSGTSLADLAALGVYPDTAPNGADDSPGTGKSLFTGNGGTATGTNDGQDAGDFYTRGGDGSSPLDPAMAGGDGGDVQMDAGTGAAGNEGGSGGWATMHGGAGGAGDTSDGGYGGNLEVASGGGGPSNTGSAGPAGTVNIDGGDGGAFLDVIEDGSAGTGGPVSITGGDGGFNFGAGDGGSGGDIQLVPGVGGGSTGGSPGTGGKLKLFNGTGLTAAARPAIAVQSVTVDVAAFNALRTALIALGVITAA